MKALNTQLVVLTVTLVAFELLLQVVCFVSLDVKRLLAPPWQTSLLPDARLVLRGNPLHFDADSAGYRNPKRLKQADIVTLGDSQTHGPERRDDAWPMVLSTLQGRAVYNMALPGYGPLQSYLQLDEAFSLKPKVVIVAPYFGNDFFDSFVLYRRHQDEFRSWVPADLIEQAVAADKARPIENDTIHLFKGEAPPAPRAEVSAMRHWISEYLKLFGLLRALKNRLEAKPQAPHLSGNLETAARSMTPEMKQLASVFDGPGWRTILTSAYRNRVVDDNRDPRIGMGYELARAAVARMAERCKAASMEFVVVLIPTKETVFFPRVPDPSAHPQLAELVANEARLREEWLADLKARGIRHVDVLTPLRQAPEQPYRQDLDGHPTAFGHRLIATEVNRALATAAGK